MNNLDKLRTRYLEKNQDGGDTFLNSVAYAICSINGLLIGDQGAEAAGDDFFTVQETEDQLRSNELIIDDELLVKLLVEMSLAEAETVTASK